MYKFMNKRRKLMELITFVLLIFGIAFFLFYFDFQPYEVIYRDKYPVTFQGRFYASDKKDSSQKSLEILFDIIPEKLINQFYAENGKLMICSDRYYPAYVDSHPAYFCMFEDKPLICLNAEQETDGGRAYCLAHEFGHYLDFIMNYPSATDEFNQISTMEFPYMSRPHDYYTNPDEYFAQQYAYYLFFHSGSRHDTFSDDDAINCPMTFSYLDSVSNEFLKFY